ncbi:Clustered mitochondria protein homolog [Caenorhabditis elegans]|uniref:Clustered mitochondria protein homolog n=1 Tax=Caenorhabditis elegans TaxID=6239 RepID=CLU_CAEEL|nr:Clustered mitochondria protein homolog [Caenorhabditis elegans]P34466.1 RecName: Full=Clustered mitochondria protein homolog [Caenorhabditis elegans]CAA81605.1 Clustered mitochondria protein homolog [Caenorhabditis elegans]|eukprot:NP_499097.1 Clustered mitochondria protein homolog [Caenorhabditis elegans]
MTLGSETKTDVEVPIINGKHEIPQEENDSGHSSINTPDSSEPDKQVDKFVKITIQPSCGDAFELHLSDNELVQELYQTLLDREATCHRTCFSLYLNGTAVDNYSEVRAIPGFVDGCTLNVVDEPYTIRDARLHLRQVRELLKFGLTEDQHEPPCTNDAQSYLTTINLQPEEKKEPKPSDILPPDHALPGCKERSLAHLLVPQPKELIALKDIAFSPYNPPPGPRKLRGDVLYIDITTVENRIYHVTCCTRGFYVNNSQDGRFDPTVSNSNKTVYQSVIELLQNVSPGFKKVYPQILKRRQEKTLVERLPTSYPVSSWVGNPLKTDGYMSDSLRAIELTEPFRVGFEDHMPGLLRDWNEELQTTFEMTRKSISERVIRDRSYYKIHADYVNAAARGVQSILDGNILAINPGEDKKTHMYIWNNIFFSLGFDVRDHYKELGGDAAAFAATSTDLQGVRAFATLDDPKLNTLGMAIFDYRGYRVTAQSIIPGILEREQEQSVVYGSIDFGKTVVSDEKYHELLEDAAHKLKMLPHTVISEKDGVKEELKLYTSYEAKGIIGNDGRKYVLDLLRSMPPDVHYLDDAEVSEAAKTLGYPRKFPHKLSALRRELIDAFCESRLVTFIQLTAKKIRDLITESKEKNDETLIKQAAEAETELSLLFMAISEDKEFEAKNKVVQDAIKEACAVVHSIYEDRYVMKFNPDCFSSNVKHAPTENLERQRRVVVDAADFLLTQKIPELVQNLKDCVVQPIDGDNLADIMHINGINIRYLGEIGKRLENSVSFARPLVLSDIVARSAKHVIRKINVQITADQLSASTSHILNCLFSVVLDPSPIAANVAKKANKKNGKKRVTSAWSSLTTSALWNSIREDSASYYGYPIEADSLEKFTELHDIQKTALFRRICKVMGVQLVARDYQLDNSTAKKTSIFVEDDIINFFPIIKHHEPFTADAKKMFIRGQQAMSIGASREAYECIGESLNLMTLVYGVMHPDMPQCLRALARLSHVLGETGDALNNQHKAAVMSERLIGLDAGNTIIEYINLAHFAFGALLIPGSLRPLYRARYLMNLVFGEKHPVMAQIDANIGLILFTVQEFDTALKYLQSADAITKTIGEPRKLKTGLISNLIARTHAARGDFRAALVAEKETFAIYSELYGPNHPRVNESSEYLRTLTQQAVTFQKKMLKLDNSTNITELFQAQPPTVTSLFDTLNIINGILIIGVPGLSSLGKQQNGTTEESKTTDVAAQLDNETLD